MDPSRSDYRWAPLTLEDVPAITELVNHLATVDGTEEFFREEDVAHDMGRSGFDPQRDSVGVWDGETLVGFAEVGVPTTPDNEGNGRGWVSGGVREGYRGQGLGRELMDRMEPRAEELVGERHHGARAAYLRASGGLVGSGAERLLRHRGYETVRFYNELTRPLTGAVTVPEVAGVQLLSPTDEHEERVRLAHNDAFRDHWGSGAQSEQAWHDNWRGSSRRGAVSTVALDDAGAVLAYVICSEWVDRELYVDIVGTVREARGRGLARAALLRTIDLATRSGDYDVVELGVDSENPSGATRLYEQVGFVHKLQTTSMQRWLKA